MTLIEFGSIARCGFVDNRFYGNKMKIVLQTSTTCYHFEFYKRVIFLQQKGGPNSHMTSYDTLSGYQILHCHCLQTFALPLFIIWDMKIGKEHFNIKLTNSQTQ